jgi:diacylglycerol kinase
MIKSFAWALKGIWSCIKSERNMRIHTAVAFYVTAAGLIVKLERAEWLCVLLCFGLVMGLEMVNTAIEDLCDKLHPEHDATIGRVKDIAAGAVLAAAVFSAIAGAVIFINARRITAAAEYLGGHIVVAALLIISLPIAIFYIVRRNKNDK